MKTDLVSILLAAFAASSLSLLAAQPAPVPVREVREFRAISEPPAPDAGVMAGQPVTFLGVTVSKNVELSAHLGLPHGMGLVITTVSAGSPAEGVLKSHDVLTKFDDQWLVNAEQLAVLVRSRKADEEVALSYIRAGKPTTARVKLATRPAPEPVKTIGFHWDQAIGGAPAAGSRVEVRNLPGGLPREEVDRTLSLAVPGGPGAVGGNVLFHAAPIARLLGVGDGQLAYSDDEGSLEIKTVEGKRELVAKDADGKVLYQGPLATESDRKALPEMVRARLERLEGIDHLRFRTEDRFKPGEVRVFAPAMRAEPINLPLPDWHASAGATL